MGEGDSAERMQPVLRWVLWITGSITILFIVVVAFAYAEAPKVAVLNPLSVTLLEEDGKPVPPPATVTAMSVGWQGFTFSPSLLFRSGKYQDGYALSADVANGGSETVTVQITALVLYDQRYSLKEPVLVEAENRGGHGSIMNWAEFTRLTDKPEDAAAAEKMASESLQTTVGQSRPYAVEPNKTGQISTYFRGISSRSGYLDVEMTRNGHRRLYRLEYGG